MRLGGKLLLCCAVALALAGSAAAQTQQTVRIEGSSAVLLRPPAPRGSVILMPGGHGSIGASVDGEITQLKRNMLVRTRHDYVARGLAVLVLDADADLASAVAYMSRIRRPVTVIATSRGTVRAALGVAAGAKPDALVLTSGFLSDASGSPRNVMNILGSPAALPRTLVIHHRQDACRVTLPAGVDPFLTWAGGKARVAWISGGVNAGGACEAMSFHGFNGVESQVVALAAGFR